MASVPSTGLLRFTFEQVRKSNIELFNHLLIQFIDEVEHEARKSDSMGRDIFLRSLRDQKERLITSWFDFGKVRNFIEFLEGSYKLVFRDAVLRGMSSDQFYLRLFEKVQKDPRMSHNTRVQIAAAAAKLKSYGGSRRKRSTRKRSTRKRTHA